MADHHAIPLLNGATAHVVFTEAEDGDFRVVDPTPGLDRCRAQITEQPWSWLVQVHGDTVHTVDRPGGWAGDEGDGLVTVEVGCPISVTTADCAPVVLVADRGLAVVHAGWRGLVAGIVEGAAARLQTLAGGPVTTLLGPCIGPEVYEFGADDLAAVIDRYGDEVAATTEAGTPALDLAAGVAGACRAAGWPEPPRPASTRDPRWFSHRMRGDRARQAAVAWLVDEDDAAGDPAGGARSGSDGGHHG